MQARKIQENLEEAVITDATSLVAVPLESVHADKAIPFSLYLRVGARFVFFRKTGDTLTANRANILLTRMADAVFVPKTNWVHFVRTLEEKKNGSTIDIRHLCYAYLKDVEEKKELFKHELKRYRAASDNLAIAIHSAPNLSSALIRRFHELPLYFANHSVNTAIYSIAIGTKLNLSVEKLKTLSFAALFHNVGNLLIPEQILFKPTALTSEEKHFMRTHTLKGTMILEKLGLPKEISEVAMQHHEHVDGAGYPLQLVGAEISLLAKICCIAHSYDTLQSKTPYHEPLDLSQAKQKILDGQKKFDPKLVEIVQSFDF
jgi:putative nucleotidyltransferase with HDIG domain